MTAPGPANGSTADAGKPSAGPAHGGVASDDAAPGAPAPEPLLRVVSGQPSDEDVAALTVVLASVLAARAAGPGEPRPGRSGSGWAGRPPLLRTPLRHGPGAWRRSALPH